jgi:ribulose-phosphate 3-epimerase
VRPPLDDLLSGKPSLSVGLLTADLLSLGDELMLLEQEGVSLIHVDVMDGCFCPQLTVGPVFVRAIPDRFVRDVHLMVDAPLEKVEDFVTAGADILTFHLEAAIHPHRVLQALRGRQIMRGIALNPGTPVSLVEPLLNEIELLLILAVNPGWSGQTVLASTAGRLAEARRLIGDRAIVLAVDGGVTRANIGEIASYGPNLIVTGSAVFDGRDVGDNVRRMMAEIEEPKVLGIGAEPRS